MPGFVVCSLRAPSTIKDCSHFSVIMDSVELYNSTFPLAPKVQLQEKCRFPINPAQKCENLNADLLSQTMTSLHFKIRKNTRKYARQSAPAPAGRALCTARRIFLSTIAGGPPALHPILEPEGVPTVLVATRRTGG